MKRLSASILCISLLLWGSILAPARLQQDLKTPKGHNYQSPFRYAIIYNEIEADSPKDKNAYRHIEVLLDEKAFSEQNLKDLFGLLIARFQKPNEMFVEVSTNLVQVDTPEERDQPKFADTPANLPLDAYPSAVFTRKRGNEWYRYTVPQPGGGTSMKTIVLKGNNPDQK